MLSPLPESADATAKCSRSAQVEKYSFFAEKISYIGHVILPACLQVTETTTKAIQELQEPTKKPRVQSCLGPCNLFQLSELNVLRIAASLNRRFERKGPTKSIYRIRKRRKNSVNNCKETFIIPPVLELPHVTNLYNMHTDIRNTQVGFVLFQEQTDGCHRRIGCCSRTLDDRERKLVTKHKEYLGVF